VDELRGRLSGNRVEEDAVELLLLGKSHGKLHRYIAVAKLKRSDSNLESCSIDVCLVGDFALPRVGVIEF